MKVGLKRRKENPAHTGKEEYNFFLSVLFPHDQLMIMDYNRSVTDLNGLTVPEFLEKIKENFEVEKSIRPGQTTGKRNFWNVSGRRLVCFESKGKSV